MKIEKVLTPDNKDIDFLTRSINKETVEFGDAYPFAFFVRNKEGDIIAGCNGSVMFGAIYTDQLWVHPNYRKQEFGRQLMQSIHEFGKASGCKIATVNTMSFQHACRFYEKLGYVVDFNRSGYARDSSCLFLKKIL